MTEQEFEQIRSEIGRICRDARKEKGLTQQNVADITEFDVTTIRKFESGRFWIGLRQYVKIKAALGLPLI